jgi:CheY-like chemotaxis protein
VPLDRAQMQQVLLNLTLNAIQAMRATGRAGRLTISAAVDRSASPPTASLRIADDGPGVAPEHRDRLFVPFFTTKEPGAGTGLGLAVSFGIVAAHGGRLTYQPGDPEGATFLIELPLETPSEPATPDTDGRPTDRQTSKAASPPEPLPGPEPPPTDGDAARPRVLVLDDEPSIRRFLAKALAQAGCDAVLTETGVEALDSIREAPFDAVLCDHRMAGMSGTEVYDAAIALRPEMRERFVFMSGDVLNPELRAFAESRGVALLAKPFELETVGRTVREVTAARGAVPAQRG